MPNQPNNRRQQDTAQLWRATSGDANLVPTPSAPYRGNRAGDALCWAELNKQPVGTAAGRNLNTR